MKKLTKMQELVLDLTACTLFDKEIKNIADVDIDYDDLLYESRIQGVLPIVYSAMSHLNLDVTALQKQYLQTVAKNIRVVYQHIEIGNLLHSNGIPYSILKGCASASYYKEPLLRTMGDVDFLVSNDDFERVTQLLKSIGYKPEGEGSNIHIAFHRTSEKILTICEMHRSINGVPKGEIGDKINKLFDSLIVDGHKHILQGGDIIIPDRFHHGLVLLLHTAVHLTSEGVGLRHLCDWAVFVESFTEEEFKYTFELTLKEVGLWRFASLLTLCCVKYLGCTPKSCTGTADDKLLEGIIIDIMTGGNFGKKDVGRYSQIKYLSDRKKGVVSTRRPAWQLLLTINENAKRRYKFVNSLPLLLPVGWLLVILRYFVLLLLGKRKPDTIETLNNVNFRRNIYKEFHLFE